MAIKHFEVYTPQPVDTPGFEARATFRHQMAAQCNGFLEHGVKHFEIAPDGQISSVDWDSWDAIANNEDKAVILGYMQAYISALNEPTAYLVLPEGQIETATCGV